MPRKARLDVPGALHHIMVRGINKSAIFDDDQDRRKFLERLGENIVGGSGSCRFLASPYLVQSVVQSEFV